MRFGNAGWCSTLGPSRRTSASSRRSVKITQCGLPTDTAVMSRVSPSTCSGTATTSRSGPFIGISGATKVQRPISTVTRFIRPSTTWQRALDPPALGVHREGGLLGVAVVVEVLGEDAQPVARLLGLAAVRVQDAQPEIRPAPRRGQQQDAVRAHAPVAVADARDLRRGQAGRQIGRVDHDVVVAEPVALREGDHARDDTARGAASQSRRRAGSPRTSLGSRWRHFRANRASAARR